MHVDARGLRKERKSDEVEGKRFPQNPVYLWNFYKERKRKRFQEDWQGESKQIIREIKEENSIADETLVAPVSSIQVQPDELRRQHRGFIKNPAVAAAGR
jgi:hypothetical protein